MSKRQWFIANFDNHSEFETFEQSSDYGIPNVSLCKEEWHVHYNPLGCTEEETYTVRNSSSPEEIGADDIYLPIMVDYTKTYVTADCETGSTDGSQQIYAWVGVNKSTEERTVTGTVEFFGNTIEYSVRQKGACVESTSYTISNVSYPSNIDGDVDSFDMSFDYTKTVISRSCTETITQGSDTVNVYVGENPDTVNSRVISDTYDYNGTGIPYNVTQGPSTPIELICDYNVTDTASETTIANDISSFSKMYVDGVEQESVSTAYTFSTTGNHTVKYLTAKEVNPQSFKDCTSLTSVEVGNGVKHIYASIFSGCINLTGITIPDTVTAIGDYAFNNCQSLVSVNIPNNIDHIGYCTFQGCTSLESIVIPDSVMRIYGWSFSGCTSLTSVTIGTGATMIEGYTFGDCSALASITCMATDAPQISQGNPFNGISQTGTLTIPTGTNYMDWTSLLPNWDVNYI